MKGLEWVLIQGQMGIELWTAEVVLDLKKDYPELKLGIITPFLGHTQRWNEQNQAKYASNRSTSRFYGEYSSY